MVWSPRRLTVAVVLLATALAGTVTTVTTADAAPDRADRALARAADRYGVSAAELRDRLAKDPSLRLTETGVAYFIDPEPEDTSPEPSRRLAQAFPLPETFLLHSKPGSQRTIYLDFNGHDVSNTAWNGPAGGNLPNGSHPAMDLAGNGPAFTDAEKLQVQDIFQRVAEDYAPFDVDVTTEQPPAASLTRSNAADTVYGTRALISPSDSALDAICGGGCGGVAFIGVFNHYAGKDSDPTTHSQYQPAWVFPQALGNDVKNIAEATTHEVGHNLGLDHDATTTQNYYEGHAGWAPIMGVGYEVPISQFSLNDYPNARLGNVGQSALQSNPDDLVTITTFGAGFRTDEPGTSIATAGPVPSGSGYIRNRTDVDFFALGACSGAVTVNANGAAVSPNLDIEVQLLNAVGTVLDSDNPTSAFVNRDIASGLDASVSASSLPSGQYYARVDGIGRGAPGNGSGYTDYGSVGAYRLSVAGCGGVTVTPPSAPQNLTGSYQGGGEVQLDWSAPANNGGGAITGYNIYEDGTFLFAVGGSATGAGIINTPSGVHDYGVAAVNSAGEGPQRHVSVDATDEPPAQAKPGKPRIGDATRGKRGGKLTATVRWRPPLADANPAINGYRVIAYRKNNKGKYVKNSTSPVLGGASRSVKFIAGQPGSYKFAVKARNGLGFGRKSAKSNAVRPR